MAKENIEHLFSLLDRSEQVEVITSLYWMLTDYQKDRFLEATENA